MIYEVVPWKKNRCGIYQDGVNLVLSSFCCDRIYEARGSNSRCPGCGVVYGPLHVDDKPYPDTIDLSKSTPQEVAEWLGHWRKDLEGCEVQIT